MSNSKFNHSDNLGLYSIITTQASKNKNGMEGFIDDLKQESYNSGHNDGIKDAVIVGTAAAIGTHVIYKYTLCPLYHKVLKPVCKNILLPWINKKFQKTTATVDNTSCEK